MNRRRVAITVCIVAVLATAFLLFGLSRTPAGADAPVVVETIVSPSGLKDVRLAIYGGENTDGSYTFGILDTEIRFQASPWRGQPLEMVKWVDDDRYLVVGQYLVEAKSGQMSKTLMIPERYTALSAALSPSRKIVATEVINKDAGQIEVWLTPVDGGESIRIFAQPVSTRFGDVSACVRWGQEDTLFFDYYDAKTSYVYVWTPQSDAPVRLLIGANRPIPSPDGKLIAVITADEDGRGAGAAIYDAATAVVVRDSLPTGWVTWLTGDSLSVHWGQSLTVCGTRPDSPSAERMLDGLVIGIAGSVDGLTVTAITPSTTTDGQVIKDVVRTVLPQPR